ncbi:MAG: hypothetical protein K2H64_01615 [Desulfovibrio sp.]|nr:hypothetical protein [Desulfovibrio sp.]
MDWKNRRANTGRGMGSLVPSLRSLVLVAEKTRLAGVVLRRGLSGYSVEDVIRSAPGIDLNESLRALRKKCEEKGLGELWTGNLKICLPADEALFQDFRLPPSSLSKARKTIPILLDGELPLGEVPFVQRTTFAKRKTGICAVTTIAPREIFDKWREASRDFAAASAEIVFFPWPIIAGLPRLKNDAALICLAESGGAACALDKSDAPLRVCPLGRDDAAENVARRARMLLTDLDFHPAETLLFGRMPGLKQALEEEFAAPCRILGVDLPIGGRYARLGEDDPARLIAVGTATKKIPPPFEKPVFRLKFDRETKKNRALLAPVAISLVLLAGFETFFLVRSLDNAKKAANLRTAMIADLKKVLPDAPKNASLGRLTAILDSRLREMGTNATNSGDGAAVALLENLHRACPPELNIDIYRMTWEGKRVRLNGRAGAYEDVDALKRIAEKLPGTASARIVNASIAQGERNRQIIEFEADITRDSP